MTDIFNTSQEQTDTPNDPNAAIRQQADIFVEKLLEIKREDGTPKYETLEDALEALKHSQSFIPQLQQENADLRKRAEEAQTLKETLERLQKGGSNVNEEKPNGQPAGNGGLSEEAAAELVERKLREREEQTSLVNNIKTVQDTLIQKHGSREKAQEFVVTKAKELNMSPEDLKTLSARSPAAALALLGEAVKPSTPLNSSTVRVPSTPPTDKLEPPAQSLLSGRGASTKNQADYVARIRENVYKRLNVQT